MKINWGTGLVIVMILFMSFIMFFVIKMSTEEKYKHDLVTEDYYKREMVYQEEIDAEKNFQVFASSVTGERIKEGWTIQFPKEMNLADLTGTVFLYRPSNEQLDFDLPIVLSGSNLLIPDERLLDGRWNITIEMEYQGEKHLYKKEIFY
ncbi:MAG: FixH family protein [Flavobacteriaceae bacterium]|nr:FixH family protein [Flavobacteriaceae bacterium]